MDLNFKTAFYYPFNRPAGLLNILWVLIPIIGWLAYFGYLIVIIKHFIKGDFKKLPVFNFWKNLNLGFYMFIKMIPLIAVILAVNVVSELIPFFGFFLVNLFISLFIIPILVINFFNKETVESCFELRKIKVVFDNFNEYLIAVVKSIALQVIFFAMIIVLVGIPAGMYTKNIFFANFYRKYIK